MERRRWESHRHQEESRRKAGGGCTIHVTRDEREHAGTERSIAETPPIPLASLATLRPFPALPGPKSLHDAQCAVKLLTTISDPFVVVVLSISFIASIFFLHIAAKIVRALTK